MTPARWRDIEELYHAARERQPEERAAFLRDASAGDESLRAVVESLLARRDEAAGFMEPSPEELAAAASATLETPSDLSLDDLAPTRPLLRRWPWWVWCCTLLMIAAAGSLYWALFTGLPPVGWALSAKEDGSATRLVLSVQPGSPAERAGLEVNDLVAAAEVQRFVNRREPYAPDRLEVVRGGQKTALIFTAARKDLRYWAGREGRRQLLLVGTSVLYLALAGLLLFSRPRDRSARWGALLLTQLGFVMLLWAIGRLQLSPDVAHRIRVLGLPVGIAALLGLSFCAMTPAGAFGFSTVFPRPLPLSNRLWWLFVLAPAVTISPDFKWFWLPVYGGPTRGATPGLLDFVGFVLGTIFLAWALALLAYNYRRLESRNERRRVRIVALGFVLTFFALTLRMGTTTLGPLAEVGLRYQRSSPWQFVEIVFVAAAPICMTYAILRHRVFDIHVMIRLGLRYAVARGVLLSILPVAGLVLVFDVLFHRSEPVSEIVAHRGLFYVALGTGALLLHVKRGTWMDALDRRFFRERYDAYQLLSAVAEDIRRSPSFDEAARQVIARIASALHPEGVSLMMRRPGESMYQTVAAVNEHVGCIPADARLVALARVLNKPLENPPSGTGWLQQQLPRAEVKLLRRARLEWLFPVVLGATGPEAFLLVGPKRSEEPYSREDRMMLQVIAASLALVLAGPAVDSASGFAECPECGTCYDSETGRCDRDDSALLKSPYSRMLAGRYRLDRRLGRGGMGSVYEVADTLLERRVAVKVIRQDWIASADALARFRREAKAAASFSHAHVVTVHDFGVADDGRAYLVMERLEGRTLREELRERRSLEPTRALGILRAVAAAVVTAHERRMIHRDLKPDNIFLARSEDGELVKVLDFGLVKPLGSADADSMAGTAPGALIGTLAYMSPEQRASEAPTESWDIWALTVTAFEMLTGVHPFAMYADPGATLGGHRDTIRPVSPVTLSAPVAGFFERALSADAAHRPTSVRQLIEELEAVL